MKKILIVLFLFIAIIGFSNSSSNSNDNNNLGSKKLEAKDKWSWKHYKKGWIFKDNHGHKNINSWNKVGRNWFWFDSKGYAWKHYGWANTYGGWVYNKGSKGLITSQFKTINHKSYWFDKFGHMHKLSNKSKSTTKKKTYSKSKKLSRYWGAPLNDMNISQGFHEGLAIDYQPHGCFLHPGCVPAKSINSGTAYANWHGSYGLQVIVDHGNGLCSRYAHLSSTSIRSGQKVSKGTKLGYVGSTGASTGVHLHFEVRHGSGSNCMGYMINPHSLNI